MLRNEEYTKLSRNFTHLIEAYWNFVTSDVDKVDNPRTLNSRQCRIEPFSPLVIVWLIGRDPSVELNRGSLTKDYCLSTWNLQSDSCRFNQYKFQNIVQTLYLSRVLTQNNLLFVDRGRNAQVNCMPNRTNSLRGRIATSESMTQCNIFIHLTCVMASPTLYGHTSYIFP